MESSEAAARRLNRIASHLAATPQNSCPSSLASVVCSSSSGLQSSSRRDGRLLFARQDSSHLPAYSREFRECQDLNAGSVSQGIGRKDNRLLFARQGRHTQAYFMRKWSEYQLPHLVESEGTPCKQLQSVAEAFDTSEVVLPRSINLKDSSYCLNVEPLFARVVNEGGDKKEAVEPTFSLSPPTHAKHSEHEWRPRMNVEEYMVAYVVTVELPGVHPDGIRVEVNEERLFVSGSRSPECWIDNIHEDKQAFYHRKELLQGPFKTQWPMPKHISLDSVSAEFMDGFLRIVLPKHGH